MNKVGSSLKIWLQFADFGPSHGFRRSPNQNTMCGWTKTLKCRNLTKLQKTKYNKPGTVIAARQPKKTSKNFKLKPENLPQNGFLYPSFFQNLMLNVSKLLFVDPFSFTSRDYSKYCSLFMIFGIFNCRTVLV